MKSLLLSLLLAIGVFAADKKISDDTIFDQVRRVLANDPDVKGGAFQVDVKDGIVTVQGKVDKESTRKRVEKVCKKVKGVTAVNNQVKVEP